MKKVLICPSVLTCDFLNFGQEIKKLEEAGADMIHCDIMDGVFVPNISFGPKIVSDIKRGTGLPLDVHLMITDPIRYFKQFAEAGADIITFHIETGDLEYAKKCAYEIHLLGCRAGIVISPDTKAEAVFPILPHVEMVLVMSVYPGFGGQKFMPLALQKVSALRSEADRLELELDIQIDGGINIETAKQAVSAGANVLVCGSFLIDSKDKHSTVRALRG